MLSARGAAYLGAAAGLGVGQGGGSSSSSGGGGGGGPPPPPAAPARALVRARRRSQQQQQQQPGGSSSKPRPCCAARALWGSSSNNNNNNDNGADDDGGADPSSSSFDGGAGPFGRAARRPPNNRHSHAHNTGRRSADADRRRRALLDYALGCTPSEMDAFAASSPQPVVAAMRATVANMLGTLPPAYFEVRVLTEPQTLAHLFFSAAMTGWMFRNCVLRLELRSALAGAALDANAAAARLPAAAPAASPPPPAAATSDEATTPTPTPTTPTTWSPAASEQYAPGCQKDRVEGDVLLWHLGREEVERVPAPRYIAGLESEVARLRAALADAQGAGKAGRAARAAAALLETGGGGAGVDGAAGGAGAAGVLAPAAAVGGPGPPAALQVVPPPAAGGRLGGQPGGAGNPLLEYLRALDAAALKDLTAGIGEGAAAAVDAFVARLLGVASARDGDALRRCDPSECSAAELGRALFWLMVVGYTLRSLEMQLDLDGVVGGGGGAGGGPSSALASSAGGEWGSSISSAVFGNNSKRRQQGGGGGGLSFWKWPSL